jgi:hypothetical protein
MNLKIRSCIMANTKLDQIKINKFGLGKDENKI